MTRYCNAGTVSWDISGGAAHAVLERGTSMSPACAGANVSLFSPSVVGGVSGCGAESRSHFKDWDLNLYHLPGTMWCPRSLPHIHRSGVGKGTLACSTWLPRCWMLLSAEAVSTLDTSLSGRVWTYGMIAHLLAVVLACAMTMAKSNGCRHAIHFVITPSGSLKLRSHIRLA